MENRDQKETRYYVFKWIPIELKRWGKNVPRTTIISLPDPSYETARDCKRALQLFISRNGNLTKNQIISIKECNQDGQIGEDIVPEQDNNIVPTRKEIRI